MCRIGSFVIAAGLAAVLCVGCGDRGSSGDNENNNTNQNSNQNQPDAAVPDAGQLDAGQQDASPPDAGPPDASQPVCGDGVLDTGEECDDGNLASHDGCSSGCTLPAPTWTLVTPAAAPEPRSMHVMAYDAGRQRMVVFGGSSIAGNWTNTWEFDGATWTEVTTSNAPGQRTGARMTYDATRAVVVLFGGHDGTNHLSETWEYDGSDWTDVTVGGGPSARGAPAFVFYPGRGGIVLFGGYDGSVRADTWLYNGAWSQLNPPATPPPRDNAAAAYDALRGRLVLFGGFGAVNVLDDTWEYTGNTWIERQPVVVPPARYAAGLGYTHTLGQTLGMVVLFGGFDTALLADTWEFDGTNWVETTPSGSPSTRSFHTLVGDEDRGRVLLFGGGSAGALGDTWEYAWLSTWPDEICNNSIDDDLDGLLDCLDPDCFGVPGC